MYAWINTRGKKHNNDDDDDDDGDDNNYYNNSFICPRQDFRANAIVAEQMHEPNNLNQT